MYYLQSSLSEVSKLEQEHVIDYMTSEVGLSSYPDANILMSLEHAYFGTKMLTTLELRKIE